MSAALAPWTVTVAPLPLDTAHAVTSTMRPLEDGRTAATCTCTCGATGTLSSRQPARAAEFAQGWADAHDSR